MSFAVITHSTPVDLEEAADSDKRSDMRLLIISFIFLINLTISIAYVWINRKMPSMLLFNLGVFIENTLVMLFVVYQFNKYKY